MISVGLPYSFALSLACCDLENLSGLVPLTFRFTVSSPPIRQSSWTPPLPPLLPLVVRWMSILKVLAYTPQPVTCHLIPILSSSCNISAFATRVFSPPLSLETVCADGSVPTCAWFLQPFPLLLPSPRILAVPRPWLLPVSAYAISGHWALVFLHLEAQHRKNLAFLQALLFHGRPICICVIPF